MSHVNKIAILGGDDRQYYMAARLKALNIPTAVYGLDLKQLKGTVYEAASIKDALSFGNIVLCPVPFSKNQTDIFAKQTACDLKIDSLLSALSERHCLFGGVISSKITDYCQKHKIPCFDFMKMESVITANTVATAEGTIAEAILHSQKNLHLSSGLVLGFGHCAKILAQKLSALSMQVTIAARNPDALAFAKATGYQTVTLDALSTVLPQMDFVFNTIPALILDAPKLSCVKKDVVIIDIASKPGGTDFEYAAQMKLNASLCLSLPGKYAPLASADILLEALFSILPGLTSS